MLELSEQEKFQLIFETIEQGNLKELQELILYPNDSNLILKDVFAMDGICTRNPNMLIIAAAFYQLDIMGWLLSNGADPNYVDKRKRGAIHIAAIKESEEEIKLLIQFKANVNILDWDNCSALHYCAAEGFIAGAAQLLDAGAVIDSQTRTGDTPLVIALANMQNQMVKFLLSAHCNVETQSVGKRTPLFFVNEAEQAKELINAGASVHAKDEQGYTPLHIAAARNLPDVIQVLLSADADPNVADNQKSTALHMAAENGFSKCVEVLLENGAKINPLDIARRTPEMLARRNEQYEVLEAISKHRKPEDDEEAPLLAFRPFAGVRHSKIPDHDTEDSKKNSSSTKFEFDIEMQ